MKIDVEVKVQGAVTAEQADTILLFTKGVSAKNADYLDEIDDLVPVDHSSLCMFRSPFNGKYVIAHWQNGLLRPTVYLETLKESQFNKENSIFKDTITQILEYGVTIEQESFLAE